MTPTPDETGSEMTAISCCPFAVSGCLFCCHSLFFGCLPAYLCRLYSQSRNDWLIHCFCMNCEGLHRRFRKRGQRPVSLNSKRKNCAIDPTCIRRHIHSEFAPLVQTLDHLATPTATSTAARLRGAFPKVHSEKRVLIKMQIIRQQICGIQFTNLPWWQWFRSDSERPS